MKVNKLFVIVFIVVFSLFITLSLCKHDDDDDDYDIKVNTKVKDEGDEITVNVVIKNNHHHDKELDDIQDDKANRCKGLNRNNSNNNISDNEDNEDNDNDNDDENAKNHHGHHHHGHHRDICGCKFGKYGKDCRKRELEYQNSFIEWSNQFNRTYTADQFLLKYEAFKDSSRFIKQYQMDNPNSTMILGLTQFSDMKYDEYVNIYTRKLYEIPTNHTSPSDNPCNVNINQTIVNSWREGNQDYIQVETIITNIGTSSILSFSFQLNNITSIWEVETLSNNTFTLTSWKNNIQVGSSHTFGYIQKSYSINPLLSVNKLCQDSPSSNTTTTANNNKASLLKSAALLSTSSSIDWRNQGCVQRVKNQGQCGSDYAFSAIGALETAYCLQHNRYLPDLSEQHLVDCGGRGCNGGWMHDMFSYLKSSGGAIYQSDYPYTGTVGSCQGGSKSKVVQVQSLNMIPRGDENALMQALSSVGTISVAYNAATQAHAYYSGGILDVPGCGNNPTNDALLVGYGTENGVDYWILKNSWGTGWGEQGFLRMARGKNMCGIADWGSYPIVA